MLNSVTRHAIRQAFDEGRLRVRSVNADGQTCVCTISDVLQHHTPHKEAFKVVLDNGATVWATQDHSLFTQHNGALCPVRTDDLTVGTPLVCVQDGCVVLRSVQSLSSADPLPVSYDLSVPGPENFLLSNGILAHNSYSIGGVSLDMDKASKYESALTFAADQFDKQIEKAKQTLKIVKGLQQPKYGPGVRSSFGPFMGRGVLSPRKFMG